MDTSVCNPILIPQAEDNSTLFPTPFMGWFLSLQVLDQVSLPSCELRVLLPFPQLPLPSAHQPGTGLHL